MSYAISSNFFTTSVDKISGFYARPFFFPWFIHDSERGEDVLKQYIDSLHDFYFKRLESIKNSKLPLTETEEKRLRDSLDSLINAIKVWHETREDK